MKTVPAPGRSMATSALSIPDAMPPWATRRPKRVRAAKSESKWSGFRSPVICAYSSTSRAVTVWARRARWPTRRPSGPTGSALPGSSLLFSSTVNARLPAASCRASSLQDSQEPVQPVLREGNRPRQQRAGGDPAQDGGAHLRQRYSEPLQEYRQAEPEPERVEGPDQELGCVGIHASPGDFEHNTW